jgi:hypothetical protein
MTVVSNIAKNIFGKIYVFRNGVQISSATQFQLDSQIPSSQQLIHLVMAN